MSLSLEERGAAFVKRATEIHKGFYDYSKVEYVSAKDRVEIICPVHGSFWSTPNAHTSPCRRQGCPQCTLERTRLSQEEFVESARKVHGEKYSYDNAHYVNHRTKIPITCPEHGDFMQTPHAHLAGKGCPICGGTVISKDMFIKRARRVHGDRYDYSKADYQGNNVKVTIICPEHGEFTQLPLNHTSGGNGCPRCGARYRQGEDSFYEWLCSVYKGPLERNNRSVLVDPVTGSHKEIDFFLPELRLAVEFNGVYWHTKYEKEDPGYHSRKARLIRSCGLRLVTVTDREWNEQKERVQSRILAILTRELAYNA